jgi:starvation-inducible DNA-binding protein
MMEIKIGMTAECRKKVADAVRHLLADTYAIYLKTQNFHWNVKGSDFFALHLLFEKQYSELAEAVDEIAERSQALGFHVDATFAAFKKDSCVKDAPATPIPAKKMLQQLVLDHDALIRCAREIATLAEEKKDQATVDLMARRLGAHEKMAWMLRSHL